MKTRLCHGATVCKKKIKTETKSEKEDITTAADAIRVYRLNNSQRKCVIHGRKVVDHINHNEPSFKIN